MAYPVILFNNSTGSDTAASGAGPSTALSGTSASYSESGVGEPTKTFTLDGSPDLSGVATDGSHVIWVSTSEGRQFFKITAVDDGADTVEVDAELTGTTTGLTWAIGGKRATLAGSSELYDNDGAVGDMVAGWVIELESGYTETVTSSFIIRCTGTYGSGVICFRGESGAATKPVFTNASNIPLFSIANQYIHLKDFDVDRTGGTDGQGLVAQNSSSNAKNLIFENIDMTGGSASNRWSGGYNMTDNAHYWWILNCLIEHTTGTAVNLKRSGHVRGCKIRNIGGSFVKGSAYSGELDISFNEMYNSTLVGIDLDHWGRVKIAYNTIINAGSHCIDIDTTNTVVALQIFGNIIAAPGGYGIYANGSISLGSKGFGNLIYNPTSGISTNVSNLGTVDTTDPDFVDAANGDVTPQADLEGLGDDPNSKSTTSYMWPGCVQPECVGGGGGSPRLINGGLIS